MVSSNAHTQSTPQVLFSALVPAAGTGARMGGCKKPFLPLCGKPVIHHVLERLRRSPGCVEIIVVLHEDEYGNARLVSDLKARFGVAGVVMGGPVRQASVLAGLEAVNEDLDIVLIHDAVRPLVQPHVVRRVAEAAARYGAAVAAVPATDTVKEVEDSGRIICTPPREGLWLEHTPQGFRRDLILRAHHAARDEGFCGTDDAQLVERLGEEVHVVRDTPDNLKITTEEDLVIAEAILRWRKEA